MSTSRATTPPLYLGRPAPGGFPSASMSSAAAYPQFQPQQQQNTALSYRTSSIRLANAVSSQNVAGGQAYGETHASVVGSGGGPNLIAQPATLPSRPPPVEMPRSRPASPALPQQHGLVGMMASINKSGGSVGGYSHSSSHAVSRPPLHTASSVEAGGIAYPGSGGVGSGEGFYAAHQMPTGPSVPPYAHPQQAPFPDQSFAYIPQPPYYGASGNASAHSGGVGALAHDALAQFQAKMDQEREMLAQQDQEELALAAEESSLRLQLMSLENERRQVDSDLLQLHQGWAKLFEREEWFHATPYIDLSQQCAAVHNRIAQLQRAQEQFDWELEGHRIELKKFDGNEPMRNKQMQAMKSLEECLARCDARRRRLRSTIERHFDTEAARERAATRYVSEGNEAVRRLKAKLGVTAPVSGALAHESGEAVRMGRAALSDRTNATAASVGRGGGGGCAVGQTGSKLGERGGLGSASAGCSRAGSFSESAVPLVTAARNRVVTFGRSSLPNNEAEDAPPALQTITVPHQQVPQQSSSFSALEDAGSICLGLDDGPTASHYGAPTTVVSAPEPYDAIAALNSTDSFAFSMCDSKRVRREVASY